MIRQESKSQASFATAASLDAKKGARKSGECAACYSGM